MSYFNVGHWSGSLPGNARFTESHNITINQTDTTEHPELLSPSLYIAEVAEHGAGPWGFLVLTMTVTNYPNFSDRNISQSQYYDFTTAQQGVTPTHWHDAFRLPDIPEFSNPVREFMIPLTGDTWKLMLDYPITSGLGFHFALDARHF